MLPGIWTQMLPMRAYSGSIWPRVLLASAQRQAVEEYYQLE
ncbi:hypothetical protein Hanom_Chr01g00063571 [Helianthus anomalus]